MVVVPAVNCTVGGSMSLVTPQLSPCGIVPAAGRATPEGTLVTVIERAGEVPLSQEPVLNRLVVAWLIPVVPLPACSERELGLADRQLPDSHQEQDFPLTLLSRNVMLEP